jgi:mannose-1-phosphate guanylyltransferase
VRVVEAVIVAGGFGTRLRPLTDRRPKHVLPVAGVPFLDHLIAKLAAAGTDRIVLATSYRSDVFAPTFGDGATYGVELVYVSETEPLGTGGAIRNAAEQLRAGPDEPVVVLNGDILSGHDIEEQCARHAATDADVTLALVEVDDARAFGSVPTDDTGRVTAFLEKSADPVSNHVNAGCYVFRRSVIDSIPAGTAVSVERETFPDLLAAGALVVGHLDPSYWRDVGTPAALVGASRDIVLGLVASHAFPYPAAESRVLTGAQLAKDAVVNGGSTIGKDAVVGPQSVISGSIVDESVRVGAGAQVVDSVVGPDAVIGEGSKLSAAVVGDAARVGSGCELGDGAAVACGAEVAAGSRQVG